MVFAEFAFALVIALFFTLAFTVLGRRAKSWKRILIVFFVILLGAWAGGVWITPVGPTLLGVYWLTFFIVGLVFALLLEAVTAFSESARMREKEDAREAKEEREIEEVVGIFFLILFLAFVAVIIFGYIHRMH